MKLFLLGLKKMELNTKEYPEVIRNALAKFWEADYFITLMQNLECSGKGIIELLTEDPWKNIPDDHRFPTRKVEKEFSYLLSAYLNACYSSSEFLKLKKICINEVKSFRKRNKNIYGSGSNGGWRTKTTHYHPVEPGYRGELEEPFNQKLQNLFDSIDEEELDLELEQDDAKELGKYTISIEPIRSGGPLDQSFYFDDTSPQETIISQCKEHLIDIGKLIDTCKILINSENNN